MSFFAMTTKINTYTKFSSIFFLIFAFFITHSTALTASEPQDLIAEVASAEHTLSPEHSGNPPVDIAAVAFEHILDSHSWHFWGEHEHAVSLSLPVILKGNNGIAFFMSSDFNHDLHGKVVVEKNGERFVNFEDKIYYASETPNEHGQFVVTKKNAKGAEEVLNAAVLDFSITKNVAQMFLSVIVLLVLFTSIAKSYKSHGVTSAPKGKQSFFEPLIVFVRDDIAKGNIGKGSEKFVPYLLTVFFLILINNVFGLIPIGANLTGNIAFTLVLATFTLIITNINGNKNYWSHIFLPHAPKAIWPILIPIEIVGILTKPFALMIRLFANIAAGHIIVISLVGLIFIFKSWGIAPVSVAFALFIDVLECLVAFLQAYIFTMLTALFIGSAVADHNGDGAHDSDDKAMEASKH
jgi:F-type H+-transporting ATPase subunit a